MTIGLVQSVHSERHSNFARTFLRRSSNCEAYARTGQISDALRVASSLQQTAPKAPSGWTLEGDVHMAENKFADAARAYQRGFSMSQSGLIVIKIHAALAREGKAAEGESRIKEWLVKQPTDAAASSYLAEQYLLRSAFVNPLSTMSTWWLSVAATLRLSIISLGHICRSMTSALPRPRRKR